MAVVDGITTGATVILKKLSSIVENEITLVWDFNDELKKLQITLNMILAVMEDAEKKQVNEASVRLWMKDLKATAYDADDILDEYYYEVIHWKHEKEEQDNLTFLNKVCNLCSNSSISFVCRWYLAHQIKEINERFKLIANCMNDLGLHTIDVGSSSSHHVMMTKNRETNSLVHKDWKFVGRENDKSKIIKTALDKNSCFVIPIVGLGGMGKTTLARQVYNDPAVQKHFDIKVWVCVSDPFDVKKLLKNIASSIGVSKQYDHTATMDDIACQLQDALRGKKFLLVLDDVWNENYEDWRKLKTPLMMGGAEESKILVTTRSAKVAGLMEDKFPHYELGILNDNNSWSLFKQIAFGSAVGAVETPNLVEIGKEMVKKCGGLPLAVIFLGSLMQSKKQEKEWEIIKGAKLWHEYREGKNYEILPSLRLSYDYLPSHLKLCFSYCCLFPKDWIIERETLIRLWMAEGFLIETPGKNTMSMEEIGNEYFHSLLSSFFFQDVVKNYDGEVVFCKMHDLVNDLARSVVENHEYLIVENALDIGYISEETRRLSLLVDLNESEVLPKILKTLKKAKKLRTIFVDQQTIWFDIGNAFKENKRLRVLHLNGYDDDVTRESTSIGGLKHLRYLFLPQNLTIPKGIDRLRFLQTLMPFIVGEKKENKNASVIQELEGLNLVRALSIENLQNVTSGKDACRANLKKKKNLFGLYLSWGGRYQYYTINNNHEAVLEGLQPHPNLRKLWIVGFKGAKLPKWIEHSSSCLPNLVVEATTNCCLPLVEEINILHCPLLSIIIPPGTTTIFPSLKILNLEEIDGRAAKTLVTNNLNFLTSLKLLGLPNLITLPSQGLIENNNSLLLLTIINCPQFKGFVGDQGEGTVSSLQYLTLYGCPALRFLPCIRSLTSLRALEIQDCKESRSLRDELMTCLSSSSSSSSSSLEDLEHVVILKKNKTATAAKEVVVFEWRKPSSFV